MDAIDNDTHAWGVAAAATAAAATATAADAISHPCTPCETPCSVPWAVGTHHSVSVDHSVSVSVDYLRATVCAP